MNSALPDPAQVLVKDSAASSMARRSLTPSEDSSPSAFWVAAVEATKPTGKAISARPAPIIMAPCWMRSMLRVMRSEEAATVWSSERMDDSTPSPRSSFTFVSA